MRDYSNCSDVVLSYLKTLDLRDNKNHSKLSLILTLNIKQSEPWLIETYKSTEHKYMKLRDGIVKSVTGRNELLASAKQIYPVIKDLVLEGQIAWLLSGINSQDSIKLISSRLNKLKGFTNQIGHRSFSMPDYDVLGYYLASLNISYKWHKSALDNLNK